MHFLEDLTVLRPMMADEFGMPTFFAENCCDSGPPEFRVPPPPDPTLIFSDFLNEDWRDFELFKTECEAHLPTLIPIEVVPSGFEPVREYVAFIATAIIVMLLVSIGATLAMLWLKRSSRCRNSSKSKKRPMNVSSNDSQKSSTCGVTSGRGCQSGQLKRTQWSYNGMPSMKVELCEEAKAAKSTNLESDNYMHQTNSLGMMMYGDEASRASGGHYQNGYQIVPAAAHAATLSQPLSKRPNQLHQTRSAPYPLANRNPQHASAQNLPRREDVRIGQQFGTIGVHNQPTYEEITLGRHSHLRASRSEIFHGNQSPGIALTKRLPPPMHKPPPPPLETLESPCSENSCSCSAGSTSLDQELDGFQLTPSPRRKVQVTDNSTSPGFQNMAISEESFAAGSAPSTSSPPNTANSSDHCIDCNNGRESGYGTDKRKHVSRGLLNSSPLEDAGNAVTRLNGPGNQPKQNWLVARDVKQKSIPAASPLTVFVSEKPSSTHSMTYV